jgi:putative nucleotidyltransferase with HDIG domain
MEGFWQHCLCTGVTSKLLAKKQGIDPKYHQEYFTAGLLHDIGKIPLNAVLDAEYMQLVSIANRENKPLFVVENENLGVDHCTAGAMIAKAWKLDSSVHDVITCHHDVNGYSGENLNILYNVAIANFFSLINDVGFAGDRNSVKPERKIWDTIGLTENTFSEINDHVFMEIEKAKIFLNIASKT